MTIQPNEAPRPAESPVQTRPSDQGAKFIELRVPVRLMVLSEITGIPVTELERRPAAQIRFMMETYRDAMDEATRQVVNRILRQQGGASSQGPEYVNLPASQAELQNRIDEAYQFLSHRYAYHAYKGGPYDFQKEYSAYPVGLIVAGEGFERQIGHYIVSYSYPFSKITSYSVYSGSCYMDVGLEDGTDWDHDEPIMWMDRFYSDESQNGQVLYQISVRSYGGTKSGVDLYAHGQLLLSDLKNQPLPQTFSWTTHWGYGWEACRYTVRHGHLTTWKAYDANEDGRAWWLWKLGDDFGFNLDVYDPMFHYSQYWPHDRWLFDPSAYHDCDLNLVGVSGEMPVKMGGSWDAFYYPYNSNGINVWGKDSSYASSVRTNAFLVLETLLGYQHGDNTSKQYADRTADVLIQVQWGSPPFPRYKGESSDHGVLTRGQHQGGQLLGWKPGSGFQFSLPPDSWLSDVVDSFSMPDEEKDFLPSNTESTATYLQALRVSLKYRYGVSYPTSRHLP